MKLRAFHVKDGDCLLIRGDNDTVVLADGGRSGAFEDHVAPVLTALGTDIDLVYVSHIDNDHVSGILTLFKTAIGWKVHEFHVGEPDYTGQPPEIDKPEDILEIWHNGFDQLVDDQDGKIHDALELATQALALRPGAVDLFHNYENLATGVKESLDLNYRLHFAGMDDIWNHRSTRSDKLMLLSAANEKHSVGEFELTILGPTVTELEALRVDWNDWLDDHDLDVEALRQKAEEESSTLGVSTEQALLDLLLKEAEHLGEGSDRVSEPNVASLTALLDDGTHSVLLTGDARSEELLAGLEQHGLVSNNQGLHVNVLKVQHHGAAGNVTEDFCKTVTADHYLFCANGAHTNPEKVVLDGFLDYRVGAKVGDSLSPGANQPFTFWFTTESTTPEITSTQKTFLESVEKHLADNWDGKPGFTRKYPDPNVDPFSVTIDL